MTGTTAPDPHAPTGAEATPGSPAGAPGTPGSSPAEAAPPRPSSLSRPLSSSAVFGTGDLAQTPMHYGEPLREQRALAERGAIVDLPHVRVLRLTGADRLTWLNSITTQKIDTLAPGVSTETLVLDPNGRIEGWLRLIDDGEALWALSDLRTDETLDFLRRMVFMMRVEIADVSEDFQAIGAIRVLPESLPVTQLWSDPWPHIGSGSASYAEVDLGQGVAGTDHPGLETPFVIGIVSREDLRAASANDFRMAGFDAWEALRVAAWRPGRNEIDHKSLVGELDLLRTSVHLAKGCYRGQEAVARVHNLGQPPRRLVFVHLDGSGHIHPDPGAEVLSTVRGSDRPVGVLTSVAQHFELGPIGLAVIKRTVAADAPLSVDLGEGGTVAGAQEIIVAPERGHDRTLPGRNRDVDMRNQHR
ncbi:CAF17-like 4Fe-4S cluster assembly/insertion protein YgfZ [Brevibacterium casei]|uniref:Folate-binding protein YgfZ n=1 Tax=Brevibacterium casei TaxID=33889 RepID=A0A7T2THK4_9MICO|nr:folate-binding protein YgfZ [Brevibacterium casei]MCT1550663.1 folate-binding protein YgfZ [Brevibacterium casei]MCT1559873.1 folate-binding protein YgfZ [Brevibacterium casei]MCT2206633.1 folate-binding protein YgfZ [Brevibacterium casei]QPS33966.1 folate-binding protein YgfZ [Brevibacterium casei]